jgi:hypothetical protein
MLDFTSYSHSQLQKLTRQLIIALLVAFLVAGALGINFISSLAQDVGGGFKDSWKETFQPILVNLMSSTIGVLVAVWLFSFRSEKPQADDSAADELTERLGSLDSELANLRDLLEREREAKFTMADLQQVLAAFNQKDKAHSSNLNAVSKNFSAAVSAGKSTIKNGNKNSKNKDNT